MFRVGPLALLSLVLFTSPAFGASIVFSTYAPGNTYDPIAAYTVGVGYTEGNLFQPSMTGKLEEIDLALGHFPDVGNDVVNVQLLTNNNGTPGSLLEAFTVYATSPLGSQGTVVAALSVAQPILDADQAYWLLVTSDAQSNNPWYYNSLEINGLTWNTWNNGTYYPDSTMAAFRVFDSEIYAPEPSSFVLVVCALCVGVGVRARRFPRLAGRRL
jgi:hypothetical protein